MVDLTNLANNIIKSGQGGQEEFRPLAVVLTEHKYDRLPYLIDALNALNCQSYRLFTVILIDDSQNKHLNGIINGMLDRKVIPSVVVDEGAKARRQSNYYAASIAPGHAQPLKFNMIYVNTMHNVGASAAMNLGIDVAVKHLKAKYIALQDGDDISLYNRFEQQIEALQDPNVNVVGTDKLEFGIKHFGYVTRYVNPDSLPDVAVPEDFNYKYVLQAQALFWGSALFKSSLMFKSDILSKMPEGKLFDDSYKSFGDDIIMNNRFGLVGGLHYIPKPLLYYRRHNTNLSLEGEHELNKGYKKAVKQNLKLTCDFDADETFLTRYANYFHHQKAGDDAIEFFKQSKEIYAKNIIIDRKYTDFIVDELIRVRTKSSANALNSSLSRVFNV